MRNTFHGTDCDNDTTTMKLCAHQRSKLLEIDFYVYRWQTLIAGLCAVSILLWGHGIGRKTSGPPKRTKNANIQDDALKCVTVTSKRRRRIAPNHLAYYSFILCFSRLRPLSTFRGPFAEVIIAEPPAAFECILTTPSACSIKRELEDDMSISTQHGNGGSYSPEPSAVEYTHAENFAEEIWRTGRVKDGRGGRGE